MKNKDMREENILQGTLRYGMSKEEIIDQR